METVEGPSTGRRSSFLVAVPVLLTDAKPRKSAAILGQEPLHHPRGSLRAITLQKLALNNILTTQPQLPSLLLLLCTPHVDLRLSLRIGFSAPHLINSQLISYLRPRASENECIASFRPCAEGYCSQVMPLTCAAFPIYQDVLDQSTTR